LDRCRNSAQSRCAAARLGLPDVAAPPKQQRAQDVLDRIVEASRALLSERDFETISIADIAARARLSVGVFYTRFSTKEHLLAYLARELAAELHVEAEKVFAREDVRTGSLLYVAEAYFTLSVAKFVKHRSVLRPLSLIVRLGQHAELRDLTQAFNAGVHGLLRDRMLQHRAEIAHDDPEAAINFAILTASAALREAVLYGEPVSRLTRQHMQLGREAARACVGYLRWNPRTAS
jgi:AcrR family transcriptional regulator